MNRLDDFLQFVRERRSVRRFRDQTVPREVLDQLLEAASWAPSASNRQDWWFSVVTNAAVKEQMVDLVTRTWNRLATEQNLGAVAEGMREYSGNFTWFGSAPVLIAVAAKTPEGFLEHLFDRDAERIGGTMTSAAFAAQNLMLAAHAAGLGTCCLTGPLAAATEFKDLLGFGSRRRLVCILALGYPEQIPSAPKRKPVTEISRYIE